MSVRPTVCDTTACWLTAGSLSCAAAGRAISAATKRYLMIFIVPPCSARDANAQPPLYCAQGPRQPNNWRASMSRTALVRQALWLSLVLLVFTLPAAAQYQTAVVDGTISPGEYAYSSGNWSLTWDTTYLYVAHASTAQFVFYVDVDPQTCSIAGTNANGNVTGVGDQLSGSSGTITPTLPLRADARALTGSGGDSLKIRDGSGGWTTASGSPI